MTDDRKRDSRDAINAVIEMVDAIDQKHEAAHKRVRADLDTLTEKFESQGSWVRDKMDQNIARLGVLSTAVEKPVSFDKIFLSPKIWLMMIGWLLTMVVTIVISFLATTSGLRADQAELRSDVRDILTRMEAQKVADAARDKLRDVEAGAVRADVNEIKRLQQLQQLQLQQVQLQQVAEKKGK